MRARRPDVRYRIVGSTDDRVFLAQLEARIAALGLQDAVELLGRVSDEELLRLYHGYAAFWLLPVDDGHQFEGFGLVYWEANACGRPVIGALRSGAEDAIEDGLNGYLVPRTARRRAPARAAAAGRPRPRRPPGAAGRARVRPWKTRRPAGDRALPRPPRRGARAVPALDRRDRGRKVPALPLRGRSWDGPGAGGGPAAGQQQRHQGLRLRLQRAGDPPPGDGLYGEYLPGPLHLPGHQPAGEPGPGTVPGRPHRAGGGGRRPPDDGGDHRVQPQALRRRRGGGGADHAGHRALAGRGLVRPGRPGPAGPHRPPWGPSPLCSTTWP